VKIVKSALGSNDPAAHAVTRSLIEGLGVLGHLGLRTLLAEDPTANG
jgi:hypothetical protein